MQHGFNINIGPCADSIVSQLLAQGVLSYNYKDTKKFDTIQAVATRMWWSKIGGSITDKDFYMLMDKLLMVIKETAKEIMLDSKA